MPKFEISDASGKYEIEAPDENAALAAFHSFRGADQQPQKAEAPKQPETPFTLNDAVRAVGTGVPVVGGLLNKLNAATNATLAPVVEPFLEEGPESLKQDSWQERYKRSLELQEGRDKQVAKEHPVKDTALNIVGGVGGMIPAVLAAPKVFGAVGTLPQMVKAGAGSGAAISAADAVVRGDDPLTNAVVGGVTGAVAPLAGRAIGAGIDKVRDLRTPAAAPVAQNTVRVGDVDVPLRQSQVSGDLNEAAAEQELLHGARGARAQNVAQAAADEQAAAMQQATTNIGANLDEATRKAAAIDARLAQIPAEIQAATSSGDAVTEQALRTEMARLAAERAQLRPVAATQPQDAGQRVATDLGALEQQRAQAAQAQETAVAAQGENLRAGMGQGAVRAQTPFDAGESIGTGVRARRDAAVAARDERYDALREVEGTFDRSVPMTMADEIRMRVNSGDDPLWVDPTSTSKANEAFRMLDETIGKGLFANRAAPLPGMRQGAADTLPAQGGGAAAPAAPAPASEAQRAYDELVGQGINPARARQAVGQMPGASDIPATALDPHSVALPDGSAVQVRPRVVEADQLLTSADQGYDRSLQPRNRARAASDSQINDISRNLNPARLGLSTEADRGAPIIGDDLMVESGNGRVQAIRNAYRENGEAAARYREFLRSQGVPVDQYRNPVLVRQRETPMTPDQRRAFTVGANQSATAAMSAPERALADARGLTPDILALIRNPADLAAADNRDFVRAFVNGIPQAERGAMMDARGALSAEGLTRVRNAVLASAYGDSPVLGRIAESVSDDIRSISNALQAAAPEWAALKADIAAGRVPPELDITGDLIDAVNRTATIRGKGVGLDDSLAQADAFAQQSPNSLTLQRFFYDADGRKAASAAQISSALRNYAQQAAKVDANPGLMLGMAPLSAGDILEATAAKVGAPKELAKEVTEAALQRNASRDLGIPDLSLREMDNARKRLVKMYGDARRAAMAPGGSGSDAAAMGRIIRAFDDRLLEAFDSGQFSGDGEVAKRLLREARASHQIYKDTFTSRGGSDPVGRAVEKILGRYSDTAAQPDEIARLAYGSLAEPGGGEQVKIAMRLRRILGETSAEWEGYKQGLFAHLVDTPAGTTPRTADQIADRIERFLGGDKGRGLAQAVFSAEERRALADFAAAQRGLIRNGPANEVDRVMARLSGADGGLPPTPGEVVEYLYGRTLGAASGGGKGRGLSVKLATRLKADMTPEAFDRVRQGMWSKLTDAGEGKTPFGHQKLAQNLAEFLDGNGRDLARVLFTQAERNQMKLLQQTHQKLVPVAGSTNPSGSGYTLTRVLNRSSNNLLAMLGGVQGGFTGMAAGWGIEKLVRSGAERKAAKEATRLFYGQQPVAPKKAPTARAAVTIGQSLYPALAN